MKNQLFTTLFLMLLGAAWPAGAGAEMSRPAVTHENYVGWSKQDTTEQYKEQKLEKRGFLFKKVNSRKLFGAVLLGLLLIGGIGLVVAAVNGGGAILGLLGFLLSVFFLILFIRTLQAKLPKNQIETIPVKHSPQKSWLVVAIVVLILLTLFFALSGVIFIGIAFGLGEGVPAILFGLIGITISVLCVVGIVKIAKKLGRLKRGETIPEELPRRPPSKKMD